MAGFASAKDEVIPVFWLATWAGSVFWLATQTGVFMDREELEVHKNEEKNLANIQPSWPHALGQ